MPNTPDRPIRRALSIACLLTLGLGGCQTNTPTASTTPPSEPILSEAHPPAVEPPVEATSTTRPLQQPPIAVDQPVAVAQEIYPHVVLDRANRHVDLRGRVVGRNVDWLELLASRPGMREHETIVTLDAEAQHIQLALILLGLEPGEPARAEPDGEAFKFIPPHGPGVEVFFILDDQPDQPIPANTWVINQQTGDTMPGNTWLFTGSRFVDHAGQRFFLAEENGTLISLVNFGDDLIGRDTQQSDDGGNAFWTAKTDAIPPKGTPLTLRLRPAAAER